MESPLYSLCVASAMRFTDGGSIIAECPSMSGKTREIGVQAGKAASELARRSCTSRPDEKTRSGRMAPAFECSRMSQSDPGVSHENHENHRRCQPFGLLNDVAERLGINDE